MSKRRGMANENAFRLPTGGAIDRSQALEFSFNGKPYRGYYGDTLASALLANGVHLVARSFKYHRPRGILSAGIEEPNAIVQLCGDRDEPNVRATTLMLHDGLEAKSVNCWPSASFDVGSVNGAVAPLLPAGFYYKTFMLGRWDNYAYFIRRLAGLGTAARQAPRHRYERRHIHIDVLVVGAGRAGLISAAEAVAAGAGVLVVDRNDAPGGHDLALRSSGEAQADIADAVAALDAAPNCTRLAQTTACGYYDHNLVVAAQYKPPDTPWIHERLWHIRADRVVLATGAVERPLVFANNDRPGIMLASAAQHYVNRYAVAPGRRALYFTNNTSAYQSAFDLHDAGIAVPAILDTRDSVDATLASACASRGIALHRSARIVNTMGRRRIRQVLFASAASTQTTTMACDLLCMSGGYNPNVHLHSQSGARPVYDPNIAAFVPGKSVQSESSVGAAAGDFTDAPTPFEIEPLWDATVPAHGRAAKGKAFVDYQNDVARDDLSLALRENFSSIEHVKRYTTTGMATDQGKIGNANAIGVVATLCGTTPDVVGTTTFRPPYAPLSFGAIAGSDRGELIIPARTTPITQWNIDHNASMNEAGANFRRPFWFPKPAESDADAIARAARAVRSGVGIYDATPLGKFELHGPDVPMLLNRLYTNRFDNLAIGHGRFGLMLREDGRLFDDGVSFRLSDHWLMTCGTGAAGAVLSHIERLLQTEWTDLEVYIVNVTSQWCNLCVCGPLARDVLHEANVDVSLDADFGFMQIKDANVAGVSARIARVSYTGELSYEINVLRRHGLTVWEALMAAGRQFDITPVGSETSAVLRIEKGFISAGSEGDNITNPFDAGLDWIVDMGKGDFVGRRSLIRDQQQTAIRQHVVGLLPDDPNLVPTEGSALLPHAAAGATSTPKTAVNFQGHVTASCYSPTLGRAIALGLLKNGQERHGERILVSGLSRSVTAEVTRPVFYDPKGQRMRA